MTHYPLRFCFTALLLALTAQPLLAAEPENPGDTASQRVIEEKTAGLHVRQPQEEQAWKQKLSQAPGVDEKADAASEGKARKAVEGAKKQAPLVRRFTEDIWAKVKPEMSPKAPVTDTGEGYIDSLVRQNNEPGPYDGSHLYVFISESIPLVTLRNYQKALEGLPVTFILRGLVGENPGRLQPTQEWTQRFLCGDGPYTAGSKCYLSPVDINPNLFRLFGIEAVPAIVYSPQPEVIASCGLPALPEIDFLLWYGDVAPTYVLEQFQQARPDDPILVDLSERVKR